MVTTARTHVHLEAGDHLSREEFHRRYLANPHIKKAELIDGVVYVPSPVRFDRHSQPQFLVVGWLAIYVALHPEVRPGGDNGTLLLEGGHEVQPDAFLWRPEPGGTYMRQDGYIIGAPQFIVEVAASSASYDLHVKEEAQRRRRVRRVAGASRLSHEY